MRVINANKKLLFMAAFFILVIGFAHAGIIHKVEIFDDYTLINTTIILKSPERVNYWEVSWKVPENSEILGIWDSAGEIKNYKLYEKNLDIITNKGKKRNKEKLIISIMHKEIENKFLPLRIYEVNLPGFGEEETFARINADNMLAWSYPLGFNGKMENGSLIISGKGPLSLKISFSKEKPELEHYYYVSKINTIEKNVLDNADQIYEFVSNIFGFALPYPYITIMVLPPELYSKYADNWSEGTFKEPGIILLRNSRNLLVSLAHETAHAFNREVLKWDRTNASWFDEGSAKLVEFLYKVDKNIEYPEIFGEVKRVDLEKKIGIIKPNFDAKDLWSYYQSGLNFMEGWNPKSRNLEFGYAYSELYMREFFMKNGISNLRRAYKELMEIDKEVYNVSERNRIITKILGSEFRPCYSEFFEEMKNCIRKVNDYVPEKILETEIKNISKKIRKIPEFDEEFLTSNNKNITNNNKNMSNNFDNFNSIIGKIKNFFIEIFNRFFNKISEIF